MAFTSTSKFISTILLLASFTSKAARQTCSLCPEGSSIEDATRDFFGFGTCGDTEEALSSLDPSLCDESVSLFNAVYDQTAFCCSNVDPQEGLCSLCEEGSSLINPDFSFSEDGLTCSDMLTAFAYIANTTICESFTAARPSCCSGSASTCQLCPNGGEIAFPDKAVPFLEEGFGVTTCGELDRFLSVSPEAECGATLDGIGSILSYTALCGCTDVTPPGICDFLCGEGDLIDPDQLISDADGTTCGEVDELARYVVDATSCESFTGSVPLCCSLIDQAFTQEQKLAVDYRSAEIHTTIKDYRALRGGKMYSNSS